MRRDSFHGVVGTEETEFIGTSVALFAHRHLPAGDRAARAAGARAAVLVCPAILDDAEADYLRAVRLSRALAQRGLTVQRFHHRGTRYSDGHPELATFADLVEDALQVAEHLRGRHGIETLGVVGVRLGALVAAVAARACRAAALSLWQPVVDPHRHVEELVGRGEAGPAVLGSSLVRDLLGSPQVTNLVDMVGATTPDVQVVQLTGGDGLAPEYQRAVGRWQARGIAVDVVHDPSEDDRGAPLDGATSDAALAGAADWLSARLTAARPTGAPTAGDR